MLSRVVNAKNVRQGTWGGILSKGTLARKNDDVNCDTVILCSRGTSRAFSLDNSNLRYNINDIISTDEDSGYESKVLQ